MNTTKNGEPSLRPRPILMIPLQRCGSHALRLRLNFNPQFFSPYPMYIADFLPLVPLYGDLRDDKSYFRMVVDVIGLQAASVVKWPEIVFDPVEIFDTIRDQPRSVHRIAWELLLRAGERCHASVAMDKSLDSVHHAEDLMQLFPDMLFLNVVRDPRAQVASMNRAITHDFDTTLNAMTWAEAHRAALALLTRYPERVLTIRYEDFLCDQEETLKKVCDFFGIDYLPQMTDVTLSEEARRISRLSALWASNCFSPIMANVDKFKKQLSMEEIEIIETLTQKYMRLYGYEMMTQAQATVTDDALKAACERSDAGRRMAWRHLEETNFRDLILRRFRENYLARVRAALEQIAMQEVA